MSQGFVKIYGDRLIRSSLWDEIWQARLVFLGMLALAGPDGLVAVGTIKGLARLLNLPVPDVESGLAVLAAPDPDSGSPDHSGIRVMRVDEDDVRGWRIVNYTKYREMRTPRQVKRAEAERARYHRSREESGQVCPGLADLPLEAEAEAELTTTPPGGAEPLTLAVAEAPAETPDAEASLWAYQDECRRRVTPAARGLTLTPERRKRVRSARRQYTDDQIRKSLDAYAAFLIARGAGLKHWGGSSNRFASSKVDKWMERDSEEASEIAESLRRDAESKQRDADPMAGYVSYDERTRGK